MLDVAVHGAARTARDHAVAVLSFGVTPTTDPAAHDEKAPPGRAGLSLEVQVGGKGEPPVIRRNASPAPYFPASSALRIAPPVLGKLRCSYRTSWSSGVARTNTEAHLRRGQKLR